MINTFKAYLTEERKTIFFTFGRMNPPTVGHEKLMDKLASEASGNPYRVYLSQSTEPKKNPIDYNAKVKFARKMFPRHARQIVSDTSVKNVFDAVKKMYDEGFTSIVMVVGADRVTEFDTLLKKYNGTKARHGTYVFESIKVISAGDRDPDSDNVSGMSASKMRAAAADGDFTKFGQGLPSKVSNADAKALYNAVRKGMGLNEQKAFKSHVQLETVSKNREQFVEGMFQPGDKVVIKETEEIASVVQRGANYLIVEMDGKQYRKWLDAVEIVEAQTKKTEDPDIGDRKGSQPRAYHTGLKKATKIVRDRQFKKQAKKDDDDPSAYKPAPGDEKGTKRRSSATIEVNRMLKRKGLY